MITMRAIITIRNVTAIPKPIHTPLFNLNAPQVEKRGAVLVLSAMGIIIIINTLNSSYNYSLST